MDIRIPFIAILALTSQLALAEGSTATGGDAVPATPRAEAVQAVEKAASEKQIKALANDVSPSLQSKLDALMSLDTEPVELPHQEVASVN